MTSPTQRTLARLRKDGWTAQVVERWNPYAHIRQDLFGIIDILAIRKDEILGVQATSGSNVPARVKKSLEEGRESLERWLLAGGHYEVWGWAKRGARGKRKLWTVRRVRFWLGPDGIEHEG